jgi:chromosomal replication initiator protein
METRTQLGEVNFYRVNKYKPTPKVKVYAKFTDKNITKIKKIVCEHFGIPIESLQIETRKRKIVLPRQMVMYFCRKFTLASYKSIGNEVGKKDHVTVIHACKTVNNLVETNFTFRIKFKELEEKFKKDPIV